MASEKRSVEVELRGISTATGSMGIVPEPVRNTISASAMVVPELGERIAVSIILGDGTSALALLDGDAFSAFGAQLLRAGEQCALLAATPTGKAN